MDIIASIVLFGCLLGAEFSFVFGNTVSCACTDEYDPVCGEDGLDYPNPCSAGCSGVKVGHSGKCNHNAATNNATTTTQKQSICPAIYDPVCGKDKKTYSSKCVAISRGVTIAYPGQCETEYETTTTTKPTPCICPDVYDPVCGKDGKTYSNKCKAKCSGIEVEHMGECKSKDKCICPTIYAPVCGKDGKTYSNECRAKCSGTEVAYTGECRTKQNATTNTTAHCVCPAIYDPVCAKDGKTYSSKCNAECRGLTVKYTGECILEEKCICPMTYAPVCGKDGKTYSNQCDAKCSGVEVYSDGKCEDDDTDKPSCICTLDYRPVCGSDGQTYSNECHARCSGTEVAYTGQCETEYETTTTTKPTPCICSYIYDPVCGKDGKTYSSKCNAKCSGVTIAYPGQCETEYQTTTTTKPTPCVCPAVYDPVCGKDGKTYSNKCKAKCSGIEVAHKGECESKENCACSKKYAPVCGKDGKTYSNECIAKCSGVEIYSSGKCEKNVIDKPTYHVTLKATKLTTTEATTTKATTTTKPTTKPTPCFCPAVYDPVCGKDGKTYSNKCNAKCSGIEIDHQGKCEEKVADKPSCVCTSNYDPVCGSDGRTYGNECEAKCSQVDVVNRGPCRAKQDDATVVERCKCRPTFKPVCGTDEVTYGNECHARCRGVAVVYSGGCRRKTMYRGYDNNNYWNPYCICPDYFRPVCGQNGVTYASSCVASCSNVNVKSHEPCEVDPMKRERPGPTDCSCNRSFKPVCGNDAITYANSDCARRCGGVKDYVSGKCEECACRKDYNPVYNFFTGTKYANGCIARCLKVNPNHLRRSYEL